MKYLILLILTLSSCKDISQYLRKGEKATIVPSGTSIAKGEVVTWKVGLLRRQRVSKGIKVKLNFPQLDKADLEDLISELKIDGWLVRVRQRTLVTSQTLDQFYIPLLIPDLGKSDLKIKQVESGFVNLYYSAAAISGRFENFQCPAFGHRRKITKFKVIDIKGADRSIRGDKKGGIRFMEKINTYDYKPLSINIGKTMNGEYFFEIALFNKEKKLRKSNWYTLHQAIKVSGEKLVALKGCKNFKIPEVDSKTDDIRDFQLGR